MKAITAVCATGASVPAIAGGRVQRHRDGENAEIQMYLSKLKDLVPFMPKNRKISKLEVIQNVIDYICDLQNALESHPAVNTFDPVQALASQCPLEPMESTPVGPRQPLGVRPNPNTILANGVPVTVVSPAPSPAAGGSSSSSSSSNNNNSDAANTIKDMST
ncbi:protein extra-macrochaetae [Sabethes cyaneus]|uniref:protein extra-macrochaetae n=1 Tax=Sabethes cyaneus TaxID=53552 RepID=UPI00237E0463|nr:protein extra-macrochaetae [Sabethes cyaneus]